MSSSKIIFTPRHYRLSRKLRRLLFALSLAFWSLATILLLVPIFPHLLYRLRPQTPATLAQTLGETASTVKLSINKQPALPPFDSSLPTQNHLIIEKIGVNGPIYEGDWADALPKGIWRENKFGTPDSNLPTVLAAHRWGYLGWTNSYRRLNSFYSLPRLQTGDQIEIIWQQRRYLYQIYDSTTAETITRADADLILYTCQFWESPIRIFKYAKRIN